MKSPTPLYRLLILLPLLTMVLSLPPAPGLLASDGAPLSLPAMRLGQVERIGPTSGLLVNTDYYWHIETVDSTGDVGVSSSLAVDTAGHPHIGYHDEGNGYLKYAYHDGTTWIIGTIDSAGDLAHWNCLDLDSSGRPHIAYINAIPYADDLKYAHFVGAGGNCGPANDWQCYLVDSAGFVGGYSSLKVDTSDLPHVSYYDAGNTALKYARYVGSGGNCGLSNDWQCDTADNSANMGENSSLALDSADRPHITYYQHYIADLRYAYHDGMTWHFETVDSAGNVGTDSSLALDSSDRPHISYHDYTNGDLKYAYHDGSTWHFQTVDSLGNVGADSSLALDGADRPHIAYYDATNGDLKYAWYDGTLWYFKTVDSGGIGGGNLSLILDGAGRAHISYYDMSNRDLKFAYQPGGLAYSISGRVQDGSGNSIPEVTVSAGAGHSATADAGGVYTITNLITGTYTLTPTKSGWIFTPPTRTASVPPDATGQDFVGMAGPRHSVYLPFTAGTGRIVEHFDDPSLFSQTVDTVYLSDGWVHWHVSRSGGKQYVYRSIPSFGGDVRLVVRGQVDGWTNNCRVRVGIGRKLNEVGESEHTTSISVNFGFIGGGCGPIQPTLPPGPVVDGSGVVDWDFGEGPPACDYWGNWLRIDAGTPYEAELTISQGMATLRVPGVGTANATAYYNGPYDILFVGNTGNWDWPECWGKIDYVIIEPLD